MEPWLTAEDQLSGASVVSNAGAVSVTVLPARTGNLRRSQIVITNLTVGASMTVLKNDSAATATLGIPISTKQSYIESDDGGFTCHQGAIQVYSDIASSIAVTESLVPRSS